MKMADETKEILKSYEAPTVVYETTIDTRAGSGAGGPLLDPSIDVEGIFND